MPDFSSVQIPKPLDWQPFQRACLPLFRFLLGDDEIVEFGRSGQDQKGIDLLGYRGGDLKRPVGVQCRHVESLALADVKQAITDARELQPALTELIFATTAKHDARLQEEALKLTDELVKSGWNCRISIRGWEALQPDIARSPEALKAFWPEMPRSQIANEDRIDILAAVAASQDRIIEEVRIARTNTVFAPLDPKLPPEALSERQDIHTAISIFRDMLLDGKTQTAIRGLEDLRGKPDVPPFALYRIETNIGAAHLRAGDNAAALAQWRIALALRPDDPKAQANLALGLLANGDAAGAREQARRVLRDNPDLPAAVAALIQASVGDHHVTDPESLVPAALQQERDVVASVVAFLRQRDDPRWHQKIDDALLIAPDDLQLQQWKAEATLEPILGDTALLIGKPEPDGAAAAVREAADMLGRSWDKAVQQEQVEVSPFAALTQNYAAALRFSGDSAKAARVIDQALQRIGRNEDLVRVRALLHVHADEEELAVSLIGDTPIDPELGLLRAEILAQNDPARAAAGIDAIALGELPDHVARLAIKLRIELALDLGDAPRAEALMGRLENLGEKPSGLALMRARIAHRERAGGAVPHHHLVGVGDEVDHDDDDMSDQTRALADRLAGDEDVDFLTRVAGAQFLESEGAHAAASAALHGRVDVTRDTIALRTYLAATVAGRMLVRAREALDSLPNDVASVPFFKRLRAAFFWNTGDARRAAPLVADLYQLYPARLDLLLWRVDCLVRLGQEAEVRDLLASANDASFEGDLNAQGRYARALAAFGQAERARRAAYRLFMANRDAPEAWMALMAVVFGAPRTKENDLLRDTIDSESVFEVKMPDGETKRYKIESDEEVLKYAQDALDVAHPIAIAVQGLKAGDDCVWPSGGTATIASVKNKYLDAFHIALDRFNDHFPRASGLIKVHVDFDEPGGLDQMKTILAGRATHVRDQAAQYAEGKLFLAGLAQVTGVDPVEAMIGLHELGISFRVALGSSEERAAAFKVIQDNAAAGCVVDGATLHLVRRLSLESVVQSVCGPIAVSQATVDRLRERLQIVAADGHPPAGTLAYVDGQLQMSQTTPEAIEHARDAIVGDLAWIDANASIAPAVPKMEPPDAMRRLDALGDHLFDDIYAASGAERVLLTEDLATRQLAQEVDAEGVWLQPVLMTAKRRGLMASDDYARVLADLAEFGEDFISVDDEVLMEAFRLDTTDGTVLPGRRLKALLSCLGGGRADAISHTNAALGFLARIWSDRATSRHTAMGVTGATLNALLRGRVHDHRAILTYIAKKLGGDHAIVEYMVEWARGHFIPWPR